MGRYYPNVLWLFDIVPNPNPVGGSGVQTVLTPEWVDATRWTVGIFILVPEPHVIAGFFLVILLLAFAVGSGSFRSNRSSLGDQPEIEYRSHSTDSATVRDLLNDNNGRMRQADIVGSTEWSKAKVSRLLGELETNEEIHRIRIGREKLVYLPEATPDIKTVRSLRDHHSD